MSRKHIIALIVACALFMQTLDSTVLGTALPAIAVAFGESPVTLHLAMTSYLIALAVFMPLSGWVADRWGARDVFRLAIIVFTLASIACGLAPNAEALILARVVQGLGGAMMVPVGRLVLLRSVPKHEYVDALAWVTVPALMGPVLGPTIGGLLTTYASWHWIFWINVPMGLIGLAMTTIFVDDIREDDVPPLDLRGFVLAGIGIAGVMFTLETLGDGLIPAGWTMALGAVGLVSAALYIRHARHITSPVIDLTLLRVHTFRASVAGGAVFRFGIGAIPFLLPLLLQAGFGYSAADAGLVTSAAAAGAIVMKALAGRILRLFGFRSVLIWNGVLSAAFMAACALFTPTTPWWTMVFVLLVGGFFRSLQFTGVNAVAFADVEPADFSQATSFSSMMQQLSLSVGIGFGALMLTLSQMWRGSDTLSYTDFPPAFIAVGLLTAVSSLFFVGLHRTAGDELAKRSAPAPAGAMGGMAAQPPRDRAGKPREREDA